MAGDQIGPTIDEVLEYIEGEGVQVPEAKVKAWDVDVDRIPPADEQFVRSNVTEEQALAQLEGLLAIPGMLQIITNEVADESFPDTDHRRFVIHDVVRIGQDLQGRLQAFTAEGDWFVSIDGARGMLRRLTVVSLGG